MQLLKYTQAQGLGSCKRCQWLIDNDCIAVNGEIHSDAKNSIKPEEVETLATDGEPTFAVSLPYLYILLDKPANCGTSHKPQQHPSVLSLFPNHICSIDIQTAGRLDAGTIGVLLIIDDGQFNHQVTSPKHKVPKLYHVTLKHAADNHLCEMLKDGVLLHDDNETVIADEAALEKPAVLLITTTESEYHQAKHMIATVGNRVERLHREKFGDWSIDDLPSDSQKFIRTQEILNLLSKFVKYSVFFILQKSTI